MIMQHTTIISRLITYTQTTRFRLFAILFTVIYIAILLIGLNIRFQPQDPFPILYQISESEKQRASQVQIGLHINSFPKFSINKNDFLVDGIIWFKFASGSESLATLENISLHNGLVQPGGNIIHKSAPIIKLLNDDVLVSYHVQFGLKADLMYNHFPLEPHTVTIILYNKSATPQELYFKTSETALTINKNCLVSSWRPIKKNAISGYAKSILNSSDPAMEISYPAAAFSITFENVGIKDLISLYFPMFVLFFIALFCLLIDVGDASRLNYVATSVPILVLFRMIIDTASPDVGYTTHIDFVYYLLVFLSLLILLFQTYVILRTQSIADHTNENKKEALKKLASINNNVFLGALLLLIIFMTYSFLR